MNFIIAAILAALAACNAGAPWASNASRGPGVSGPVTAATPQPGNTPPPIANDVMVIGGPS